MSGCCVDGVGVTFGGAGVGPVVAGAVWLEFRSSSHSSWCGPGLAVGEAYRPSFCLDVSSRGLASRLHVAPEVCCCGSKQSVRVWGLSQSPYAGFEAQLLLRLPATVQTFFDFVGVASDLSYFVVS